MIAQILTGLLKANLAAAAAVLLVAAIRRPVRRRFGAFAAYLLWLAPPTAGLAALAPHPAARTLISPMVLTASAAVSDFAATAPSALGGGPDLTGLAFGLWVAGALAALALLLRRQAAFLAALGKLAPADPDGVSLAEHAGVGPAVVGVLRPRIVAPADFESRFDAPERALILAHERAHLRRGDAAANALACAVQCLCWFNPLAHLAARLMRIDQELACDASVIGAFPQARRTYAELLLKTQLAAQPLPLGCHWPAGAQHPLKARIAMLKSPAPERAMRAVGLAVAGAVCVGLGGIAWAANPAAPVRDVAESHATVSEPATPAVNGAADLRVEQRTVAARGHGKTPVRDAPGSYTPPPGFAEPRTNAQSAQVAPFHSIWIKKPTGEDMVRLYPAEAAKAGVSASLTLRCVVAADGSLHDCGVGPIDLHADTAAGITESNLLDFKSASLALSKLFQMQPVTAAGQPTAGTEIHIPVRFLLPRPSLPVTPS